MILQNCYIFKVKSHKYATYKIYYYLIYQEKTEQNRN